MTAASFLIYGSPASPTAARPSLAAPWACGAGVRSGGHGFLHSVDLRSQVRLLPPTGRLMATAFTLSHPITWLASRSDVPSCPSQPCRFPVSSDSIWRSMLEDPVARGSWQCPAGALKLVGDSMAVRPPGHLSSADRSSDPVTWSVCARERGSESCGSGRDSSFCSVFAEAAKAEIIGPCFLSVFIAHQEPA